MGRYIPRYDIDEALLKKLRADGLTYREISDYIEEKNGIRVSLPTICKRMKEISKKEKPLETDETKVQKQLLEEQIKKLREQGLTYREISEHLTSNGMQISLGVVRKKIKKIYNQEGKTEPKPKYKKSQKMEKITDAELQELRKRGLSIRKIQRYYNEKGIQVSAQSIWIRVKTIEEKEAMGSLPFSRENAKSRIIEKILSLETTRKATPIQMRKMAKIYGVEVEFEQTLSEKEEPEKEKMDEEEIAELE